jgi:hypothetical protein
LRERYAELAREPEIVRCVLGAGAEEVRPIARDTTERVKRAMGVGTRSVLADLKATAT